MAKYLACGDTSLCYHPGANRSKRKQAFQARFRLKRMNAAPEENILRESLTPPPDGCIASILDMLLFTEDPRKASEASTECWPRYVYCRRTPVLIVVVLLPCRRQTEILRGVRFVEIWTFSNTYGGLGNSPINVGAEPYRKAEFGG